MGNYTINGVKNCSETKGSMRLLLFMIADAIPDDRVFRTLTTQALATYCNCTERFTRELLTKLLATGELIAIQRPGYKTNYAIPILDGEPGYDPQPCEDDTHTCTKFHTPLGVTRDELNRGMYSANRAANRAKGRNHSSGVEDGTIVPGEGNDSSGVEGNDSSGEGGTVVPSYPLVTQNDQPKDKPKPRKRDEIILELKTQRGQKAERPRSKPAPLDTPRATETDARTAQTPPPPTPSAPTGEDYGTERFMYWQQVRALIEPRFGGGFMRNYFDAAKLYERAPGDYVIVCRTPMVQEQLLIRARAEIVLQLAAVVRSHIELEIITQKRSAAPVAAFAEVKHA